MEPIWPYLRILVVVTALKLLLIPSYRSTDLEVHRNWLAITHSLPISEWYVNATSEWTLDYPPLFAWLEATLAQIARYVDQDMLVVTNLQYDSPPTIIFQRLTVIVLDTVLITAALKGARKAEDSPQSWYLFALVVANAGLLIVDHIHFQYNGFLIGIQLWSILLLQEGYHLLGAILFSALLNLKHLFMFGAPVYFVYLLRHHCRGPHWLMNLAKLGICVMAVFGISFGPFVAMGQLKQVLNRLFPFGRGLLHAYWAPNAWALYALCDKAAVVAFRLIGWPLTDSRASLTGGLVGTAHFSVLPDVPKEAALLLVLTSLVPCLLAVWREPSRGWLMESVAYANLCGFVWGFHVHEKSILTVLLPLTFVAANPSPSNVVPSHTVNFLHFSTVCHYSLLPLLHRLQELPIKVMILLLYMLGAYSMERRILKKDQKLRMRWSGTPEKRSFQAVHAVFFAFVSVVERRVQMVHLCSLACLGLYEVFLHERWVGDSMAFLPLMLTSCLCAVAIVGSWARFCFFFWLRAFETKKLKST